MKTILATLFFAASALAQASPDLAHAEAACGPLNVTFDAEAAPARPTPPIDPHKALVYVIEDLRKAPGDVATLPFAWGSTAPGLARRAPIPTSSFRLTPASITCAQAGSRV